MRGERPELERLSEFSDEYRDQRAKDLEVQERFKTHESLSFGHFEVDMAKIWFKEADFSALVKQTRESTKNRRELDRIISPAKQKLSETFTEIDPADKDSILEVETSVKRFISESLGSPEIRTELEKYLTEELTEAKSFVGALDKIPNGLFLVMLKHHQESYLNRNKEFSEETFPKLREFFLARLPELIKSGVPVDLEEAAVRANEMKGYLADSLGTARMEPGISGTSNAQTGRIGLSDSVTDSKKIEEIVFHELMHAISGKSPVLETNDPNPMIRIQNDRSGVSFMKQKSIPPRFTWLDEAVTEELTLKVAGKVPKQNEVYKQEIAMLGLLRVQGKKPIPDNTVYAAYFEGYDTADPERVPAWKEFAKSVAEAYDPKLLLQLDKLVQEQGIDKALEIFHKDWKSILDMKFSSKI